MDRLQSSLLNNKPTKSDGKLLGSPQVLHKNLNSQSRKMLVFMEPSKTSSLGQAQGLGYSVTSKLSTNQKLAEKIGETKVSSWSSLHKNKRSMGSKDLQSLVADKISILERAEDIKKNSAIYLSTLSGRRGSIDMLARERVSQQSKFPDKSNKTAKPKSISATRRGYSSVIKHLFRKSSVRSPRQVASPLKEKIRLMINERNGGEVYRGHYNESDRAIGTILDIPAPLQKNDSSDRHIIFETSLLDKTVDRAAEMVSQESRQGQKMIDRRTEAVSPPSGKGVKKQSGPATNLSPLDKLGANPAFKKSFTTRNTPKHSNYPEHVPPVDFLNRRGNSFISKLPEGFMSARSKEGFVANKPNEFRTDGEATGTLESGEGETHGSKAAAAKGAQESKFAKKQFCYGSKISPKIDTSLPVSNFTKPGKHNNGHTGVAGLVQFSSNPSPKAATPILHSKLHTGQNKLPVNKKQVMIDAPLSNTLVESESYMLISSPSKTPPAKSSVKLLGSRSTEINFVDQFQQQRNFSANKELEATRREKAQLQHLVQQLQIEVDRLTKPQGHSSTYRGLSSHHFDMQQSEAVERSHYYSHIEEPVTDLQEVRKSLKLGRGSMEHYQHLPDSHISSKPMAFSAGNLLAISSSERDIKGRGFILYDHREEPQSAGRLANQSMDHRDSKKILLKQIESLLDMHTSNVVDHQRTVSLEQGQHLAFQGHEKDRTPSAMSNYFSSEPSNPNFTTPQDLFADAMPTGDGNHKVKPFEMYIRDSEVISPASNKDVPLADASQSARQQVLIKPITVENSTYKIAERLDNLEKELSNKDREIEELKTQLASLTNGHQEEKPSRVSPSSRHRSAKSEHNLDHREHLDLKSFREKLARDRESRPIWSKPSPRQQEKQTFMQSPPEEYQTHRQASVRSDTPSDPRRPSSLGDFTKRDPVASDHNQPNNPSGSLHSFGQYLCVDPIVTQLTEENFALRNQLTKLEQKQTHVSSQVISMAEMLTRLATDIEKIETGLQTVVQGLHSAVDWRDPASLGRTKTIESVANTKLQALQQTRWPCSIEEAAEDEEDLDEESITKLVKASRPLNTKLEKCGKLVQNLSLHLSQLELSVKSKDSQLLQALSDLKDRDDLLFSLQEHLDRLEQEKAHLELTARERDLQLQVPKVDIPSQISSK